MCKNVYDPLQEYQKRFNRYTSESTIANKHIQYISNLRLFIFVLFVVMAVLLYRSNHHLLFGIDLLCGLILFTAVVLWHNSLHRRYNILMKKVDINKTGLLRLKGEWNSFRDTGVEFIDQEHPYTWDLDIFGANSIFQWISACHTFFGRKSLAKQLSEPEKRCDIILEKQQALNELATLIDWRQKLELSGLLSDTGSDPEKFLQWSELDNPVFKSKAAICFFRFLPCFSFVAGSIVFILSGSLILFAVMYTMQFAIFALYH
ncbi:MAG TPA: hypothetical protein VHO70_22360, partial [Chitinispirillaceae bacterium]|nr:hypothetical protein [Chitinispirillaceae bacterium]